MEIKPTTYPDAYEMTKHIVKILQSNFLSKEKLKSKTWILDFIESKEASVIYFLQVKAFT